MTTTFTGELEIDHDRGVIYFHTDNPKVADQYGSVSILRVCGLPKLEKKKAIDVTIRDALVGYAK